MCGILAICHPTHQPGLGREGATLLSTFAYRGRGAGAALLDWGLTPTLLHQSGRADAALAGLDLDAKGGACFLGHIAWESEATSPFLAACRQPVVGVVHGRITNEEVLRPLLAVQSHRIQERAEGALLVHLIEDLLTSGERAPLSLPPGATAMIEAARGAATKVEGTYAFAVAASRCPGLVAVSAGTPLHAGITMSAQGPVVVVSTELGAVLAGTSSLIPLGHRQGIWSDGHLFVIFPLDGPLTLTTPRPERPRMTAPDAILPPRVHSRLAQACRQVPDRLDALMLAFSRPHDCEPLRAVFENRRDLAGTLAHKVRALREAVEDKELVATLQALRMDPVHRELMGMLRPHLNALRSEGWPPRSDHRAILASLASLTPDALDELATWDHLLRWTVQDAVSTACEGLSHAVRRGGRIHIIGEGAFHHAAETAAWALTRMAGASTEASTPEALRARTRTLRSEDAAVFLAPKGIHPYEGLLRLLRERAPGLRRLVISGALHDEHPLELAEDFLPLAFGPQAPGAPDAAFLPLATLLRAMAARLSGGEPHARRTLALDRDAALRLEGISGGTLRTLADRLQRSQSLTILTVDTPGPARAAARLLSASARIRAQVEDLAAFLDGAAMSLPPGEPLFLICPPVPDVRRQVRAALTPLISRGADVILVSEGDRDLKEALLRRHPDPVKRHSCSLFLPETGDPDAFALLVGQAFQLLALRLGELKAEAAERAGIEEHGLHPDGDATRPTSTAPCPPAIW